MIDIECPTLIPDEVLYSFANLPSPSSSTSSSSTNIMTRKRKRDIHDQESTSSLISTPPTPSSTVPTLPHEFECSICGGILRNPSFICPSQHLFCYGCLEQVIKKSSPKCPECNFLVPNHETDVHNTPTMLHLMPRLTRLIDEKLKVHCLHQHCKTKDSYTVSELMKHLTTECQYQYPVCTRCHLELSPNSNNTKQQKRPADLLSLIQQHIIQECEFKDRRCIHCYTLYDGTGLHGDQCQHPYRLVNCRYCSKSILLKDLYHHKQYLCSKSLEVSCDFCHELIGSPTESILHYNNECSALPIQCIECKSTYYIPENEHIHQLYCHAHPLPCPNYHDGCQFTGIRSNMYLHLLKDCLYSKFLCPYACHRDGCNFTCASLKDVDAHLKLCKTFHELLEQHLSLPNLKIPYLRPSNFELHQPGNRILAIAPQSKHDFKIATIIANPQQPNNTPACKNTISYMFLDNKTISIVSKIEHDRILSISSGLFLTSSSTTSVSHLHTVVGSSTITGIGSSSSSSSSSSSLVPR